jgi:hypothetical protein
VDVVVPVRIRRWWRLPEPGKKAARPATLRVPSSSKRESAKLTSSAGDVIPAVDSLSHCERESRLLALETSHRAGLGHALVGAQTAEVGFEFGDYGEGSGRNSLPNGSFQS